VRLEVADDTNTIRRRARTRTNGGLRPLPHPTPASGIDSRMWQEHVEADLRSLRDTLARIETALAQDRATVRAATGQWTAVQAASSQWPEQIAQIRGQVDQLDERIRAQHEHVRDELDGLQDDIGRLGAYTLQTQVQERMINRVEEEQARLAEAVAATSQGLVGERLRTNAIILAGAAITLISTTMILLANAPRFW
jgi:DNA repair exonuclease SbcCD ATPase subunit